MDEEQQNSEIEKIANLMVHDGISPDEQDAAKLEKYKPSGNNKIIILNLSEKGLIDTEKEIIPILSQSLAS